MDAQKREDRLLEALFAAYAERDLLMGELRDLSKKVDRHMRTLRAWQISDPANQHVYGFLLEELQ